MTSRRPRGGGRLGDWLVVALLVAAAVAWFVDRPLDWPLLGAGGRERWLAAGAVCVAFGALCAWSVRRRPGVPALGADRVLVVHATQTGFAEELANRAAAALAATGRAVDVVPLARLDAASLAAASIALFVVATYGDGEPPDAARAFARRVLGGSADLRRLRYAVLALGDRRYARFCAFGRTVDDWLPGQGAVRLFDRVDVDDGADADVASWHRRLATWSGAAVDGSDATPWTRWRLASRAAANPGTVGALAFHVRLVPDDGRVPTWEAGDIAVVRLSDDTRREYSIASLPSDGGIDLLVRRSVRPDGTPGRGAQWLTADLPIGGVVDLHVRPNRAFRLDAAAASKPAILIGNGTGLAGLRAHLAARDDRSRNWLFFGERQAAVDAFYADDLARWQASGRLSRATLAYSRDAEQRTYVQDRVVEVGSDVRRWIDDGATILVCGSATGMGEGVHAALQALVGADRLDALAEAGRYRRDVY